MTGPDTTSAELVAGFFLVCAALAAAALLLRPIYMPLWHLFRGTQQFLEDWFGEPADERRGVKERPGAMARLAQLESNGGSSARDAISRIESAVSAVIDQIAQNRLAAAAAKDAAVEAAERAKQVGVEAMSEIAKLNDAVLDLGAKVDQSNEQLLIEMGNRQAEAFELLAEHGGPDLRDHAPRIVPHVHELPPRVDPTLTGGPRPKDEQ